MGSPVTAIAIYAGGVIAHPLRGRGEWVIGRAKDADIVIEDGSVSRRHAVLRGGPPFTLEDLGSENGTMLVEHAGAPAGHDETLRLAHRRLAPGERTPLDDHARAQLGHATLLIQPGDTAWKAPPPSAPTPLPPGVIVRSPAMQRVYWLAERFAQGTIHVLLLGETGVGKEVLAEHVHRASPRRAGPFVRLNCASFRGELLESELFGHERGAFTGAVAAKPGLVERADGGTLFLDEVGEMSLDIQARLLRFLEDRIVLRIGGTAPRAVDVRVVSATNRDPDTEIEAGRLRRDLYFRLCGAVLEIPPLRDRPEEIAPLARHFIQLHAAALGAAPVELERSALDALEAQPLPGNARELRNLIERALLVAEPGVALRPEHLLLPPVETRADDDGGDDDAERRRLLEALDACGGNQTSAAKRLGIARRTLINKLDKLALPRPRKR